MSSEQDSIIGIFKRMSEIAEKSYSGNVTDNIYSIYMQLTDIERLQFLKFAYRASSAIISIVDIRDGITCLPPPEKSKPAKPVSRSSVQDDTDYSDLEIADKRELVRMKHTAILTLGKFMISILALLIGMVFLLSFISPTAIKILSGIGPIISVIVGK